MKSLEYLSIPNMYAPRPPFPIDILRSLNNITGLDIQLASPLEDMLESNEMQVDTFFTNLKVLRIFDFPIQFDCGFSLSFILSELKNIVEFKAGPKRHCYIENVRKCQKMPLIPSLKKLNIGHIIPIGDLKSGTKGLL